MTLPQVRHNNTSLEEHAYYMVYSSGLFLCQEDYQS